MPLAGRLRCHRALESPRVLKKAGTAWTATNRGGAQRAAEVDQTDFHRSEPSSRALSWDEHSRPSLTDVRRAKRSRHRGAEGLC